MAMKWISVCLVAVALLGCLTDAQGYLRPNQQPQSPPPKLTPSQKYTPPQVVPPKYNRQQTQLPKRDPNQGAESVPSEFHSCEVADIYKIQCGLEGISGADCSAINCCFDGQRCYYGKAVTVQCTKDGQFIVVVARDATLPNIDLETVSLLGEGEGCTPVGSTSAFAIYQFPVTSCGTIVLEEPGILVYQNRMSSSYEVGVGRDGAITRDSTYELLFQCTYTGVTIEALVVEVGLVPTPASVAGPGPLHVELRLGNGNCQSKGCSEEDVAFTSFYTDADYPVVKVLRDPVYVEIRMLERTDPNLVLTLGHCWTTSNNNPYSVPQWDLLIDGCPYRDDRYQTTLSPVGHSSGLLFPSHHKRFIFRMFTFVDQTTMTPLREKVFIHCNTAVCQLSSANNCEPRCFRQRRSIAAAVQKTRSETTMVTSGEVHFIAPSKTS
ncbi:zona pellucida sperm-binding protein 4-like [Polymixia lowei]